MNTVILFRQRQAGALLIHAGAALFFTVMSLLRNRFFVSTEIDRELSAPSQSNEEIFDFIIVGAGSTGCVLASQLSEEYSLLVLEAGGTPKVLHSVPFCALLQLNLPSIEWCHKTVPQNNACFGLKVSICQAAGKVLGGSNLLHAMMYICGSVQEFDEIAKKTGDERWKMESIFKYYTAIENYNGWFGNRWMKHNSYSYGIGGPMKFERREMTKNLMRAGLEMGYYVHNPNNYGPYTEGFANLDLYMCSGRRSDDYHECLLPVKIQNNIVELPESNCPPQKLRRNKYDVFWI